MAASCFWSRFLKMLRVAVLSCLLSVPAFAETGHPLEDDLVADPVLKAHFIYVGHGDATLLEFACGAVLIDAGGNKDSEPLLIGYLDHFFDQRPDLNRTLDLVVLTHRHLDHTRHFAKIASRYSIKNLLLNGHLERGKYKRVSKVLARHPEISLFNVHTEDIGAHGARNDRIDPVDCRDTVGGAGGAIDPDIRLFWGAVGARPAHWKHSHFEDENNHSVAVLVTAGPARLLFTGDLETQGLRDLMAQQGENIENVDLYQISHHGFKSGTAPGFLEMIAPRVAILSREADRPWRASQVDRFNQLVTARRARPLPVPVWRWDEKIFKTLSSEDRTWPSRKGRIFETDTLRRAVYWAGREGNVRVIFGAEGDIAVATRDGAEILPAP